MKVLFDHNVPHKLRHSMIAHEVKTADEMGWAELGNGELLRAAQRAGFAVMVYGRQEAIVSAKPAAFGTGPGCA